MKKLWWNGCKTLVATVLATGVFFTVGLADFSTSVSAREIYAYPFDDPNRLVYVSATAGWEMTFCCGEKSRTFYVDGRTCCVRGVSSATRQDALAAIDFITAQGWEEAIAVGCVFRGVIPELEAWITREIERAPVDAEVVRGNPIRFTQAEDGIEVDRAALYREMRRSCATGAPVELATKRVRAAVTPEILAREVTLLSSFSTSIAQSTPDRKHNVRLAMQAFSFYRMRPGESVSFNAVVGERTEERGYRGAKVILGGEYVDGVGGGVCQASTTIYNALLLAGVKVLSASQHSLAPSYVAPSRDAMVSTGLSDLVWCNPTSRDLWLVTSATDSAVTAQVYGYDDGTRYAIESVVTSSTPPPPAETVVDDGTYSDLFREGEESIVVRLPHPEISSEAYLLCTRDGVTTRTLLRKNKYKSVRAKVVTKKHLPEEDTEQ